MKNSGGKKKSVIVLIAVIVLALCSGWLLNMISSAFARQKIIEKLEISSQSLVYTMPTKLKNGISMESVNEAYAEEPTYHGCIWLDAVYMTEVSYGNKTDDLQLIVTNEDFDLKVLVDGEPVSDGKPRAYVEGWKMKGLELGDEITIAVKKRMGLRKTS